MVFLIGHGVHEFLGRTQRWQLWHDRFEVVRVEGGAEHGVDSGGIDVARRTGAQRLAKSGGTSNSFSPCLASAPEQENILRWELDEYVFEELSHAEDLRRRRC